MEVDKRVAGQQTICFDFDGVIHRYVSGWQGPTMIPDGVVPGIGPVIRRLREQGFKVVVNSARCYCPEGLAAVKSYLQSWGIAVDEVSPTKPAAVIYVDDRAVRFEGSAALLEHDIREALRDGAWTERAETAVELAREREENDAKRFEWMKAGFMLHARQAAAHMSEADMWDDRMQRRAELMVDGACLEFQRLTGRPLRIKLVWNEKIRGLILEEIAP